MGVMKEKEERIGASEIWDLVFFLKTTKRNNIRREWEDEEMGDEAI